MSIDLDAIQKRVDAATGAKRHVDPRSTCWYGGQA